MKREKYFLKKISDYAIVGGFGAVLITAFSGCEEKSTNPQNAQNTQNPSTITDASQKEGAFVIVEKNAQGSYQIVDEFPSSKTTIVLREDGKERILSKEEVDTLVAQEAKKIEDGTSNLTNPQNAELSGGGMSLGETLLASAAGAMIGAYIGNKLFNNNNYQNQRRASYKSPATYSKSVSSFNNPKVGNTTTSKPSSSSTKQSGFFGANGTKAATNNTNTNSSNTNRSSSG